VIELGVGLGDICPPISQLVLKNLIKMSLIIKECPEEIVINMAITNYLLHVEYYQERHLSIL
jgi:hypothetical protein